MIVDCPRCGNPVTRDFMADGMCLLCKAAAAAVPSMLHGKIVMRPGPWDDPQPPSSATFAPPGTEEKIDVMKDRRRRRRHLYHPGDAK